MFKEKRGRAPLSAVHAQPGMPGLQATAISDCSGRCTSIRFYQQGVSLIEVMVAVLMLSVGVLGAASLQLNALRFNLSAGYTTHASFIAYDMLERMRANSAELALYTTAKIGGDCDSSSSNSSIRARDISDFTTAVTCYLPEGQASIQVTDNLAIVSISWSERRTVADAEDTQFVVSSRIGL